MTRRRALRYLAWLIAVEAVLQGVVAFGFRWLRRRHAHGRTHFMAVQGGLRVSPQGDGLTDAVLSVLMGGAVLDLRQAQPGPLRVELLCVMGGVEVLAPEDWHIETDVRSVMGGIQDRRRSTAAPDSPVDLRLEGWVVMGGLDITTKLPDARRHRPDPGHPSPNDEP